MPVYQPSFVIMINTGDLVKFKSGVRSWEMDYISRNPGIVRWISYTKNSPRGCAGVYWRNGETTTEHLSYLEPIEDIK